MAGCSHDDAQSPRDAPAQRPGGTAGRLAEALARGEGVHIEFKRRVSSPGKLARELCALANSGGGTLVIGVTDDGIVCGCDLVPNEVRALLADATALLSPPPDIHWERLSAQDRRVVLLRVHPAAAGACRVHTRRGDRFLVRVGDSNRDASKLTARSGEVPSSKRGRGLPPVLERLLKTHGRCTVKAFARAANISERRARRTLVRLVREGRLVSVREGPHEFFA